MRWSPPMKSSDGWAERGKGAGGARAGRGRAAAGAGAGRGRLERGKGAAVKVPTRP